ncbi:MAG: PilN domain-containing protein [Deltaproteobacteria bacterium]|nr:PilN domain-containing protein [Deltaproteobacteria bacterium]
MMIARVNFLKREKFLWSYAGLLMLLGVWCLLLVVGFGSFVIRQSLLENRMVKMKASITGLETKKEELLSQARRSDRHAHRRPLGKELASRLEHPTRWSTFLQGLAGRLPPNILFTALKVSKVVLKGERETYHLSIEGRAPSPQRIADYVLRLKDAIFLEDVQVVKTREETSAGMTAFEISASILVEKF